MANIRFKDLASEATSARAGSYLVFDSAANGTEKITVTNFCKDLPAVFIGDTANANMTKGLTINQGAADDEVMDFKSSDVAHGVTGIAETDTFMLMKKQDAASGGLDFKTITEAVTALGFQGIATTNGTTKSTAATGTLRFSASKKSGTSAAANDANANLVIFRDHGSARWILDAEGDVHYDGTTNASAWDDHEDVALLNSFRALTMRDEKAAHRIFGGWLEEHAEILHSSGVITRTPREDGGHDIFVSTKGITSLMIDAVRQMAGRIEVLERKLLT